MHLARTYRHIMSSVLMLLLYCGLMAQKQANIWYFGDSAGIDFNGPVPQPS